MDPVGDGIGRWYVPTLTRHVPERNAAGKRNTRLCTFGWLR
jgi:hypothetical protein